MASLRTRTLCAGILVAALVGCATPGETRAGYLLQGDVQNIINANELAQGHPFGGRVVDTEVVSEEGGTVVEHWYVQRGDHQVVYLVTLTTNPAGGTDIRVTLPEEDRT